MTSFKHAVLLTMSVLAAYLFLQWPSLRPYSLQGFALAMLVYLIVEQKHRQKSFSLFPRENSASLALLNFAFLLLIGASGSLDSVFFVLSFIQLFFLAMASKNSTALLMSLEIAVFHFSLIVSQRSELTLSSSDWSNLLILPSLMLFYLFAKIQTERAHNRSLLLAADERELQKARSDDQAVDDFVQALLNKRLPMLEFLLSFPEENNQQIQAELKFLKSELNQLLRQMAKKEDLLDKEAEKILREVEREIEEEVHE